MAILMAISDRSHFRTPLGDPRTNFCFCPMAKNALFLALGLVQNGPKWPKLPFCCYFSYISMQGVIFTYFSVLSSSVVFIFVDFPWKVIFFCPAMGSVWYSYQNCHLSLLWGYNPIKVTFSLWRTLIFGLFRPATARRRYQKLTPTLISYAP